ncbi:unnamed protein product [Parnassius apollo]|uniref:(apollo) hypothetical protein n=1 Tax=Parnassius apollo TaxID=110799 RepID=A0A8S3VZ88_PARAO|nr:unnamed protein product [Parnassius apollo]
MNDWVITNYVTDIDYNYEEEEASDIDKELRPVARRTAKHIAAGEERPRINSSQQTTPIDGKSVYKFNISD